MKYKSTQIILICIAVCFLIFNIGLLFLLQMHKYELNSTEHRLEYLENVEFMFEASKEITVTRFKYEQYNIGNSYIYLGTNNSEFIPIHSITNQPKLALGLNQNMCRPCVEGVFSDLKEIFPDLNQIQTLYVLPILNNDLKTIITVRK